MWHDPFASAEGPDFLTNDYTDFWIDKSPMCSTTVKMKYPLPGDDAQILENCLQCDKNSTKCITFATNTETSLRNLPMKNYTSRKIYKGLATGQRLQIGDMLVSEDYQYVIFLAPLGSAGNPKSLEGLGALLFYKGQIQNPKGDTSWYDTAWAAIQGNTKNNMFQYIAIPGYGSEGSEERNKNSDGTLPCVLVNWGPKLVMFQKNDVKGEIVYFNSDMEKFNATEYAIIKNRDSTELQSIEANQKIDQQKYKLDSYTFVLPPSFVPITTANSVVLFGTDDDEVANRLNLKQLAAAIIKYQKDPDVYKGYGTTELSIMGLNPQMTYGKDGAKQLINFGYDGTFTGYVPTKSANEVVAGLPASTDWDAEASRPKSYWQNHTWTNFYLSTSDAITSWKNKFTSDFASGTYFDSNLTAPQKTFKANKGHAFSYNLLSLKARAIYSGPQSGWGAAKGLDSLSNFGDSNYYFCSDLDAMNIPKCVNHLHQCVPRKQSPYACYNEIASTCPPGYTKTDVTCGGGNNTQMMGYNVCKRNKTDAQLLTRDNKYECCSGMNLNGTTNTNGSVNCPDDYCGESSGNEARLCPTFLASYCKGKASQYPKYKGKTMSKQDVTELTKTATASFTSDTNVRKDYTFLSDVYPGCGCTDYPLIQIAKTAYNLSVKTAGGDTISANFASTPECWFAPCQKANTTSSLKQNNCTTAFCASVQANVEKGNNLVNSNNCTATATNIENNTIASNTTPASTPASTTPASTTPASTTPASSKTASKKSPYTKYFIYGGVGLGTLFIILMLVLIFRS